MKETITLLVVFSVVIFLSNKCTESVNNEKESQVEAGFKTSQGCGPVKYLRDDNKNLCFAYFWCGSGNGGPAFTLVPDSACSK